MSTVRYGDHRSLSTPIPKPWILIGLVIFTLSVRTVGAMDVNGQSFSHRDMKGAKVVDDILEEMTDSINTLSEDEKQQVRKDWTEFKEKTEKMDSKVGKTIKSLRATADKLDQAWLEYKLVQVAGTTATVVGGVLTIGGGIATLMKARAATPLLIAGTSFGIAGSAVNWRASYIDVAVNSIEVKKAEKRLGETIDSINEVNTFIRDSLVEKERTRLLYIFFLASGKLASSDRALKLLRRLILYSVEIPSKMAGVETVAAISQAALKSSAKAATQGGAQGAGKAGAQGAEDMVQAAGQFGAKATTQQAGKAGAQVADDLVQAASQFGAKATTQQAGKAGAQVADDLVQVASQFGAKATTQQAGKAGAQVADDLVQAGTKTGSKFAENLMFGFNSAFLMLDAIDLGFTIRDLVQNKGSDAAKILREKADKLENALK